MMLCLDAGNSRLKWGIYSPAGWSGTGVIEYPLTDELPASFPARVDKIIACNVAGTARARQIETLAGNLGVPLQWLTSSAAACGVTNGYAIPGQLGADRWAALIGARQHHAGAALVIMAGTATTIDSLDAGGRFLGGLILPGLAMMRGALARNTAGLPEAAGHYRPFPDNTDDAITSGAIQATLGAIERQAAAGKPSLCLISGGAANELLPYLIMSHRRVDNLVLDGLACVGQAES